MKLRKGIYLCKGNWHFVYEALIKAGGVLDKKRIKKPPIGFRINDKGEMSFASFPATYGEYEYTSYPRIDITFDIYYETIK